jgi:threonyl-tRNA synthetase
MSDLSISLADGPAGEVAAGSTIAEALRSLEALRGDVVAAKIDGKLVDLHTRLTAGAKLELVRRQEPDGLEVVRHSAAHVMAQAVARLFGDVEFAIGPVIEDGFYYDFDLEHTFTPEDLPRIEEEMKKIVAEDLPIERSEAASKDEAFEVLGEMRAKFKRELVEDLPEGEIVSFYRQGEFTDLCRGPTCSGPARSATRSSCSPSRAPTGAATSGARCSSDSTPPRSPRRRRSAST